MNKFKASRTHASCPRKKKKKKKAYIVYSQIDIMTGSAYINAINQENYMHELHISVFLFIILLFMLHIQGTVF